MKPHPEFSAQSKRFWACVRLLSQKIGYTQRKQNFVKTPAIEDIRLALKCLNLKAGATATDSAEPSKLVLDLHRYFQYRADTLNQFVEPKLMDKVSAAAEFERLKKPGSQPCPIPMNKQKGDKKHPAYFTAIINLLVAQHASGIPCDLKPGKLTSFIREGVPIRTFSRRVDGAFPAALNPIAIWEVKEYYSTTTFGSRVADGVYETLLDGMELEELRNHEKIEVKHYLMIDGHLTWWAKGKSYLCRIIDMLNMGYVDEVFFGREVLEALPIAVNSWVAEYHKQGPEKAV